MSTTKKFQEQKNNFSFSLYCIYILELSSTSLHLVLHSHSKTNKRTNRNNCYAKVKFFFKFQMIRDSESTIATAGILYQHAAPCQCCLRRLIKEKTLDSEQLGSLWSCSIETMRPPTAHQKIRAWCADTEMHKERNLVRGSMHLKETKMRRWWWITGEKRLINE